MEYSVAKMNLEAAEANVGLLKEENLRLKEDASKSVEAAAEQLKLNATESELFQRKQHDAERAYEELKAIHESSAANSSILAAKIETLEARIAVLTEDSVLANGELEQARTAIATVTAHNTQLQETLSNIKLEDAAKSNELKSLENKLEGLKETCEELQATYQASLVGRNSTLKEIEDLKVRNGELNEHILLNNNLLVEAKSMVETGKEENARLSKLLSSSSEQNREAFKNNVILKQEVEYLQKKLADYQAMDLNNAVAGTVRASQEVSMKSDPNMKYSTAPEFLTEGNV